MPQSFDLSNFKIERRSVGRHSVRRPLNNYKHENHPDS